MANEVPKTLGNIIAIIENRAKIAGQVQTKDRDFIRTAINEAHTNICKERSWHWMSCNRSVVTSPALSSGTSNCLKGNRIVTISGLSVSNPRILLGRSFKVISDGELYRIIGSRAGTLPGDIDITLEAPYVGSDGVAKRYKIYQYEFALPPDCVKLNQVYIDSPLGASYGNGSGQLDEMTVLEFNRALSSASTWMGDPSHYNEDSTIFFDNSAGVNPLDVMVLDYDFLAGDQMDKTKCLRIFPLESSRNVLVHFNYLKRVLKLSEDGDEPLMPLEERWILVHWGLHQWAEHNNQSSMSDRALARYEKMLKEMRSEYIKTDPSPKFVFDGTRYRRRGLSDRKLLHIISRIAETGHS